MQVDQTNLTNVAIENCCEEEEGDESHQKNGDLAKRNACRTAKHNSVTKLVGLLQT